MSSTLRFLLLFGAIFTAAWILHKIKKLKVKMEDAIFWIVFAGVLCVMGVFPELTYWLTSVMGILSPANLIFLVVIFLLIEKVFTLSIIVSQLEEKVSTLSAEVALRSHSADKMISELKNKVADKEEEQKNETL